jgi:hypothetical protein
MKSRWKSNKMVLLGVGMLLFFALFSLWDPQDQWDAPFIEARTTDTYEKLVAYEPQRHQKAVLAFENGECGRVDMRQLRRQLKDRSDWFFGIPFGRGVYTEYIHLVYVDHFEKVICNDKEFYRARLDVRQKGISCDYLTKLRQCGTDLMERRIYKKMVNRLEVLGIGDAGHYKPRRTIELDNCNCEF